MDIRSLPDADLESLRLGVMAELERRANQSAIPAQIADLTQRYIEAGGDPADLDTTR